MSDDEIRRYMDSKILKNSGAAITLSFILGFFGFLGIGHFYIRKIKRGIGYLVLGFLFLGIGGTLYLIGGLTGFFFGGVIYIIIWIFHILNIKDECNRFNDYFVRTRKQLW